MVKKHLIEGVDENELTDSQSAIVEAATTNPEWTHKEIADAVDASPSWVSTVHSDYIEEEIEPSEVTAEDLDDDIYESIVAGIEAQKGVKRVEKKYDLNLSQGGSKEIDVAVWLERGGHEFLVIIECKFHSEKIEQETVSGMIRNVQNSVADKPILISKEGFQSGAISQAVDAGVELYRLYPIDPSHVDYTKYNFNLEYSPKETQIIDLDLEPLKDDIPQDKNLTPWLNKQPGLYNSKKVPTEETIFDYLEMESLGANLGTHQIDLSDRYLLLDGDFYRVNSLQFEVRDKGTAEFDWTMNLESDYLFMEDVLATGEKRELYSIRDALHQFTQISKR